MKEKYKTFFNSADYGIFVLDTECNIVDSNHKASKMYGYLLEELKKLDLIKLIHPDYHPAFMKAHEIIRNSGTFSTEAINLRKDGTEFWVGVKVKLFDYKGKTHILNIIKDISERKKTEEKLKDSEEKYRELVETSSMGLLEIDLIKKEASYVNPKLLEIIGYSKEELRDETIFYNTVHPDDLQEITKSSKDQDLEFRIITKKGKIKWLLGRRLYQLNNNGEIIGLRLWLQDITGKKRLEELKKEFVNRTSHELKTPLVSIKGFIELFLEKYADKLDSNMFLMLTYTLKGCKRLETLIKKILESSDLTSDKIKLKKKKDDLSLLIKLWVVELSGFSLMRNISISLNLHDKLITEFEEEKIHTVFKNLLINAIQYTQPNGEVKIGSEIKDNYFIVSIQDTGIGFTEDEKKTIFTQFGKIERFGKGWDVGIDGSGLGLFISKSIIELHDGTIWVESKGRNKGSTFYFSLPIIPFFFSK